MGGKKETQKRADDGEEAWNVILSYQNNITCIEEEKKRFHIIQPVSPTALHRFWPHCWSPVLLLTKIEELVKAAYGSLWRGSWVKMFALLYLFLSPHWPKGYQYMGQAFEVFLYFHTYVWAMSLQKSRWFKSRDSDHHLRICLKCRHTLCGSLDTWPHRCG